VTILATIPEASEQPAVDIEAPGQDRRGHILFGETLDLVNG
jgi:hypothetical protein